MPVTRLVITAMTFVVCAFASNAQAQSALASEVEKFNTYFSAGGYGNISQKVDELAWTGITDEALFDTIAAKADEIYMAKDKSSIERVSWLLKALALSGNPKYLPQMEAIAGSKANKKVRKYAEISIARLQEFESWNPVIAKGIASATSQAELDKRRISNMLSSAEPELVRAGAKHVYNEYALDESLQDQVNETLLANFNLTDENAHVDAMAWLCKSLAQSGMSKYKPTLEKVVDTANNKKVRKYARNSLDSMP